MSMLAAKSKQVDYPRKPPKKKRKELFSYHGMVYKRVPTHSYDKELCAFQLHG